MCILQEGLKNMKAADVLRNLIRTMGSGNPELDEALRISALAYLDKLDPPEQDEEKPEQNEEKPEQNEEKPEQKPEKTSAPKKKKQSKIDTGKIKALREGGWTLAGIAREMGCSQQTVANHLRKMGMK